MFQWFMDLKIKNKLILTIISLVSLSTVIVMSISIYSIIEQNKRDNERYKKEEISKLKNNLNNQVDIAYEILLTQYNNINDLEYIRREYGKRLKNIIDIGYSIIESKIKLVQQGKMNITMAKYQAMEEIKNIRYDHGTGYIWINDTHIPIPRVIMHPIFPSLDGKILDSPKFNTAANNENIFQAFIKVCKKNGEGFVEYK